MTNSTPTGNVVQFPKSRQEPTPPPADFRHHLGRPVSHRTYSGFAPNRPFGANFWEATNKKKDT